MDDYLPEVKARLKRDPYIDLDHVHEAYVELAMAPGAPEKLKKAWRFRTRCRRTDEFRGRQRSERFPPDGCAAGDRLCTHAPNPTYDEVCSVDLRSCVQTAMDSLHAEERDVIVRRYYDGEPADEIAMSLHISRQALWKRFRNAIHHLRAILKSPSE